MAHHGGNNTEFILQTNNGMRRKAKWWQCGAMAAMMERIEGLTGCYPHRFMPHDVRICVCVCVCAWMWYTRKMSDKFLELETNYRKCNLSMRCIPWKLIFGCSRIGAFFFRCSSRSLRATDGSSVRCNRAAASTRFFVTEFAVAGERKGHERKIRRNEDSQNIDKPKNWILSWRTRWRIENACKCLQP